MIVKITNAELLNALVPGLQELAGMKTNGKIAYNVGRTLKSCDTAVNAFNTQKKVILETAAKKDKDGNAIIEKNEYVFPSDKIKTKTIEELNDLLTTEIDLEVYTIAPSDFEALENVSAGLFLRLDKFIAEPALKKVIDKK